eukprot:superscaffoldBa00000396_g4393
MEAHPHPEFYERIIPTLRHKDVGLNTDAVVYHASSISSTSCHSDSQTKSLAFPLHHQSARESSHGRSLSSNHQSLSSSVRDCKTNGKTIANDRTGGVHGPVVQTALKRSSRSSAWHCPHCTKVNFIQDVLCEDCEHPRLESVSSTADESQPATITEWQCKSCTMLNAASSILCEVCERPRLATRPPVTPSHPPITPPRPPAPVLGMPGDPDSQWVCQFCTYLNYSPAIVCDMCDLARPEPAPLPVKLRPPSPDGEKKGVGPEEVYTSVRVAGDSNILPCKWLKTELPLLLDHIRMFVATSSLQSISDKTAAEHTNRSCDSSAEDSGKEVDPAETERVIQLSRAEAKQAWLTAGGDTERSARQALRDRLAKVKELWSLGFNDEAHCHEVLRQSGGEVRGALALLQRPLLEPFHEHIWSDKPEPPVDIHHPDKQRICRRLLAVYDLPSWGRCELALSLLLEHSAPYSLEDVVQAVRESHDREFIKRVLAKECPICLSVFPHSKMQSLTSCQCSVCCGCFQQHFTIAVRDKHIRDMVCPVCWEPDINDPEHLNSYFSTLDIQLRECLEPEVYELFHKKLTEQALIKDPKFLWCCHWESQHAGLSCEQYQSWKRENDPEYQRQGLAGYLRDNGITCPNCRFQYALSKGGCMHFCCSQCRYQFCSGCNNPFHTNKGVAFNTDPPPGTQTGLCGVIEQKDEGGQQPDSACGAQTQPGHAGLCEKHYREYLVSLINSHSIDPAPLYSSNELLLACRRN